MILRLAGALIGGAISLLAIIIVSPNFDSLGAYLAALFIVFYVSAYASLGSGRVAYAGKQIGTTFALVFAGLGPPVDIYQPLWRIWGTLLGTLIVAAGAFTLWPEYAGDSLLPRLRRVIQDTLALAPRGSAASNEDEIQRVNSNAMQVLAEILEVADDAQLEGRASKVDHNAIVEAAGTLRRIANRLASISAGRIALPVPQLDPLTESVREAFFVEICQQINSWLELFSGNDCLSAGAALLMAQRNARSDFRTPLRQFRTRVEEHEFERIASWTLDQRRTILAELQSMRALEILLIE